MDFHRFQTALLYSVGLLGLDRLGSARHCFDRLGFETTRTTFRGGASHSTRATMENFKKLRQLGNSFLARAGESESLIMSSSWHSVLARSTRHRATIRPAGCRHENLLQPMLDLPTSMVARDAPYICNHASRKTQLVGSSLHASAKPRLQKAMPIVKDPAFPHQLTRTSSGRRKFFIVRFVVQCGHIHAVSVENGAGGCFYMKSRFFRDTPPGFPQTVLDIPSH